MSVSSSTVVCFFYRWLLTRESVFCFLFVSVSVSESCVLVCMFECARSVVLMCTCSWWDGDVRLFAMYFYFYSWYGHDVCVILVWTRCEHDRGVNKSVGVGVGGGVCVITSERGSARACARVVDPCTHTHSHFTHTRAHSHRLPL